MQELIAKIEQWAHDRNIIKGSKPIDQAMKLFSEFGELADNVGKGCDCRDDIGDVFVVLTIMSAQYGQNIYDLINEDSQEWMYSYPLKDAVVELGFELYLTSSNVEQGGCISSAVGLLNEICLYLNYTLEECVQIAYNDIKDRKGIMNNGVFIKESDPAYKDVVASIESNYTP